MKTNAWYVSVSPTHRPAAYALLEAVSLGPQGMWDYRQRVGGSFAQKVCLGNDVPEHHPHRKDLDLVSGTTPAMIAIQKGTQSIRVFHALGGKFDKARDVLNRDAGWFAANAGLDAMKTFVECGGRFTDAQEIRHGENEVLSGDSTLMAALRHGEEAGRLYMSHGGKRADLDQASVRTTQTAVWKRAREEHIMGRAFSLHVVEKDEFLADAASIAQEQGIDIPGLFRENGASLPENVRILHRSPV